MEELEYRKEKDDIEILDPFAERPEVLQYDQPNPFFLPLEGSSLKYTKTKFLADEYKNVYIMCLANDFEPTDANKNKIRLFYEHDSEISELQGQSKLVTLVQGPFALVQQQSIRSGLVAIGKDLLEVFNHESYELASKELVYLMLGTTENRIRKWLQLYDDQTNLDEFIEQKIFTSYYQLSDQKINDNLLSLIGRVWDFKYWYDEKNCILNINKAFSDRRFNLAFVNKFKLPSSADFDKELQKILKSFDTDKGGIKASNYPGQVTGPQERDTSVKMPTYVDGSKAENRGFYQMTDTEKLVISMESVEELLTSNTLSEREKYHLVCSMLSSNKYCHYILNNQKILDTNRDLIEKYKPIFRYLIGYAWISLYMEESIRKTRTQQTDRFVFDLDTASKLPVFPFSPLVPHLNPYFSLMVADSSANYASNIVSVEQTLESQNGIVNLAEFKKRLNIFMTGKSTTNLFEGANWSNMVVTGGAMSAILPKSNPLMSLFKKDKDGPTDEELDRFFLEYYSKSDIDIACNFSNIVDFIEHVKHLRTTIHKNLGGTVKESEIHVVPTKTLAIYVNSKLLKQKCDIGEIPFTYDYLVKNKSSHDVKLYFYEMYLNLKMQSNKKNLEILGTKVRDDEYFEIISYCPIDKTTIIINDTQFEIEANSYKLPEFNSGIEMVYFLKNSSPMPIVEEDVDIDDDDIDVDVDSDIFMKFSENLKYKINSKHLRHPFEIFRITEKEFFSSIARFHLPCVRSYYNGTNCYLLPSAITAYQTLTNIDFKYFVGSHDPISIIDKYRKRGYGTILNKQEIGQYLLYMAESDHYRKGYCLQNIKDIKNILGPMTVNHGYFKPRQTLPEEFTIDPNISMAYQTVTGPKALVTKEDLIEYYKKKYPKYSNELIDKRTIASSGQVEPIKHWMIEASYDLLQ